MHSWKFSNGLLGFVALVLISVGAGFAQSTATLSGTVTDPSGAVVPGAQVTVHSLATGLDRVIVTDSAGLYAVPSLEPGDYEVQTRSAGFSLYTVKKVTVDVDQRVTVNMPLAVTSAGETVQVESTASQIETQTMTVGQVIGQNTVQELPLNGRHFLDLTVLTPGGVVAPTAGNLTGASRGLGANSFITAGNREDSVNFQINGVNLNDISQNQITFQPSIDTTSEFKINNSTFSAEYGRSSGSIVNVATRSGTDRFHGEAFDYFRNEALDARNYFNRNFSPATGLPIPGLPGEKAPLKRNNFGGAVGGPIWRGHTFFFASYEGLRQHQGILQNSTVLTPAQQAQIAANAAQFPAAAALAKLIPLPNSGNNFVAFTPGPVNIDQFTVDVLHQINTSDSLHGFYAFQKDVRTEPALQGDTIPGWGDHRSAHRQVFTLNETHIFNANFVNEARLGFNRISIAFNPANLLDPSSVGINDGLNGNVGLPQITLSDIGLVFGGPSGFPQGRNDTLGVLSDAATMLRGRHTIKFGGEFRRYLSASFAANIGTLTYVSTPNNFEQDSATVFSVQPNTTSSRVYADAVGAFVQDNFKFTSRLTLEYGLRFEWNGTPVEGENRFILFNPSGPSLTQVGTNGLGANAAYNQNYNFEPRVGFAYDVFGTSKTVVRGGYAYLVDQPVSNAVTALASNPPLSSAVSYNGPAIPVGNLYNSAKASGFAISSVNPNLRNGYIESYNLNVQQELPAGIVASLGYYGSVGRHLRITTNENQASGPVGSPHMFSNLASNSPILPGLAIASNISEINSIGVSNYNATWAVLSKNMGHGLYVNMNYEWAKSMDINSLGSQGGLNLQDSNNPRGNYGLSDFDVRNHYAGTAIYAFPFKGNRLVSGYQLSTIIQYQTGNPINITAGSSSFNGVTGVVRPDLVGKVSTHKSQTAIANVTFIPQSNVCPIGRTLAVPNGCSLQIQGINVSTPTPTNPNATTLQYTGIGNIQRNAVSGPGFADVDLSGEKDTKIFEGLTFKLRVDAFDILNHPNFAQPSGNTQSATFGQISATRFATSDGGSSRQLQLSGKFVF
ncbi:TonB-dependent receptor domain-containing protein [Tunturiibacter lichenicola]|uniref:TonB-dependent receptor n=1 Tax=Tunturiibacter lichenicola TaxID=2051959 RepID=UPI003D9BE6CF